MNAPEILLVRPCDNISDKGTFGVLSKNRVPFAVTLEPAPNQGKGPIPTGRYKAKRYQSPRLKCLVFLLENVPGFSMVEIHIGNLTKHTKACVLVGDAYEPILNGAKMEDGIAYSKKAFFDLLAAIGNAEWFWLTIKEV
jgi:hypothetical protein